MKTLFTFPVVLLLFLVSWFPQNLQAQDPHFSQFYAAPVQMNPALTGVFSGEYRFIANYRTQNYAILGNQAYRTLAASFEYRRKSGRDDYYSVGLAAMRDEVGVSNFQRNKAVISGSYLKNLGRGRKRGSQHFLVGGAQVGVGQWSMDWGDLWFTEQFGDLGGGELGLDLDADNGESFDGPLRTDMFLDANAGLLYYYVHDEDNSFYFGGAFHHLLEPNISFIPGVTVPLQRRWVGQAGGQIGVTRELGLLPALAVMGQGKSMMVTGGLSLRYNNRDWREVAIRAGVWGRLANQLEQGIGSDAVMVSMILEMERLQFGMSYDITVSGLNEANNARGAFEMSVIYVHPSKERFKVICPKF
ncbi:MAG: PorP/SprF family type IX secretion system membrane protein [Bacteroidota bacterium]